MGGGQIRTLLVRCALLKASTTIAACCCQPPAVAGPPTPDPSGAHPSGARPVRARPRPAGRQSPPRPGEGGRTQLLEDSRPRKRRTSNRQHRAATQPATPSPAMRPGRPSFMIRRQESRLDRARRPLFAIHDPTHGHGRPRRRTPPGSLRPQRLASATSPSLGSHAASRPRRTPSLRSRAAPSPHRPPGQACRQAPAPSMSVELLDAG